MLKVEEETRRSAGDDPTRFEDWPVSRIQHENEVDDTTLAVLGYPSHCCSSVFFSLFFHSLVARRLVGISEVWY